MRCVKGLALDAEGGFAAVLQWHCGAAILEVRHAPNFQARRCPNRQEHRSERGRQSRRPSETQKSHHGPHHRSLSKHPMQDYLSFVNEQISFSWKRLMSSQLSSGAVGRTSSSASNCVCNAVRRPLCSGALAHASGESARGGDARRAKPHLCRARRPPKRATIPTFADGFAPAAAERRNARAYRDHMRQLCLGLLLPPKREWSRPPADVNHYKSSLIPAL